MMQQEINIPVYFAEWNPDFEDIIEDLQHSFITDDKSGTALEAMFNTVSSNGYQIGKVFVYLMICFAYIIYMCNIII